MLSAECKVAVGPEKSTLRSFPLAASVFNDPHSSPGVNLSNDLESDEPVPDPDPDQRLKRPSLGPAAESSGMLVHKVTAEQTLQVVCTDESEINVSVSLRHLRKVLEAHDRSRAHICELKGELTRARSQTPRQDFPVISSEHEILLQSFTTRRPDESLPTTSLSISRPICQTNSDSLRDAALAALSQPKNIIRPSNTAASSFELPSSSSTGDAESHSFEAAVIAKSCSAIQDNAIPLDSDESSLVRIQPTHHTQDHNGGLELQIEDSDLAWQRVSEVHAAAVEADRLQREISLRAKRKRQRTEDSVNCAEMLSAYAESVIKHGEGAHTSSSISGLGLDHGQPGARQHHTRMIISENGDQTMFEVGR